MTSRPLEGRAIRAFWPEAWADAVPALAAPHDPADDERGLYLSSYVGIHRLLHLDGGGGFSLFLWRTDRIGRPEPVQCSRYAGTARIVRLADGDRRLDLDMHDAPSALQRDAALYIAGAGEDRLLLRLRALQSLATSIGWNGTLGESERYFSRYPGLDAIPDLRPTGCPAPPMASLPQALRRLVLHAPIIARIMHVGDPPPADDPDTTAPVVVTIDKGSDDGIRHNMPLASPAGAARPLIGWCSAPAAGSCAVRIKVNRAADGAPTDLPQVGDILTSRAPSAPPLA